MLLVGLWPASLRSGFFEMAIHPHPLGVSCHFTIAASPGAAQMAIHPSGVSCHFTIAASPGAAQMAIHPTPWGSAAISGARRAGLAPRIQGPRVRTSARHLHHFVPEANSDGRTEGWKCAHDEPARRDVDGHPLATVVDCEAKPGQLFGQRGVDPEDIVVGVDSAVAPLDQIDGSGHCTEVNTFVRSASLDVVDVTLKRLEEELPRLLSIETGQDPRVDDTRQSRSM